MGWKDGIHNTGDCFLPTYEEVLTTKFLSDSVYECHQVGCDRLWQVHKEEGYWQEVERHKVAVGEYKYMPLQAQVNICGWTPPPPVIVDLPCIRIRKQVPQTQTQYRSLSKREMRKLRRKFK